jgi:hypothetical protein
MVQVDDVKFVVDENLLRMGAGLVAARRDTARFSRPPVEELLPRGRAGRDRIATGCSVTTLGALIAVLVLHKSVDRLRCHTQSRCNPREPPTKLNQSPRGGTSTLSRIGKGGRQPLHLGMRRQQLLDCAALIHPRARFDHQTCSRYPVVGILPECLDGLQLPCRNVVLCRHQLSIGPHCEVHCHAQRVIDETFQSFAGEARRRARRQLQGH